MRSPGLMGKELYEDEEVPFGILTGITFTISTREVTEKISEISIENVNEVTDSRMGLPNLSLECSTCGAQNSRRRQGEFVPYQESKSCEGHFGHIKFPFTILQPYFLSEVAEILNNVCPSCKSIKPSHRVKDPNSVNGHHQPTGCKYCTRSLVGRYPPMKFKVSSTDLFRRSAIIVEVVNESNAKFQKKPREMPDDYWNFLIPDEQLEESCNKSYRRVLSHAQVYHLLKDVDPMFIKKFVPRLDSLFLNSFLVTPNCHRVNEFTHAFSNGQRLTFDERTRIYRKLVDFRGVANELAARVLDCMKISKLNSDNSLSKDLVLIQQKIKDSPSKTSGLRWVKDVVLGKRSDHCFRMVVVGDPNIKLNEIGIPCNVADKMYISENLNRWNLERSDTCSNLCFIEKGGIRVRRKGHLVKVRPMDELQIGDTIYRPLRDGDIVLINRPPSIHQHSLIALSAKVLPTTSVLSINPLCCSPFRGDFDGDCLHGYVPQSVETRVELKELVGLDRQLINGQSGKNLLSLNQDSLVAAHLVTEDGVLLTRFQIQQLEMFCLNHQLFPAIIKAPLLNCPVWTGKQLFSTILPSGFDYFCDSNGVNISNGEIIASEGSSWLRDTNSNLFQNIIKYSPDKVLDTLCAAQEVLCEWLSMRGLSVSLLDLNLTSDLYSRRNLMHEIFYGLQEAEQTCVFKQLLNSFHKVLTESDDEIPSSMSIQVERLCYEKQKSAALSQASIDAFKQVFRDIQSLTFKYASKDNSLLAMFKAGSKGNLPKLVQQSMCLGVQHSLVPLSFSIPHTLSCTAWNNHKAYGLNRNVDDVPNYSGSYIPYAVVENSFLTGLNPLECFVHSITNRDSSFSDNAELPGTLTRRLMFFMRDMHTAYDGTVRTGSGNQIVQFSYNSDEGHTSSTVCDGIGGKPVGALSACAISEAAYSALDQPISLLETSPLLNIKNALECGSRKSKASQTMSLHLSKRLGRQMHGFEYGALEIKNYLERLKFSNIVSTAMIIYTPTTGSQRQFSPWVCHFHINKEILRQRKLNFHSVINHLRQGWYEILNRSKDNLPNCQIKSNDCSTMDKETDSYCIVVRAESSQNSYLELEKVRDKVLPTLLEMVVKGFQEIKSIDILWSDRFRELYLRVSMTRVCKRRLWGTLMDHCLKIMDLIDWSRSHPDNMNEFCLVYGVDAGWKYFLNNLESAVSDIGKSILPEHLLLVANSLSATGYFVGLTPKGLAQQRGNASVASPFTQACFSTPAACIIKAAKAEVTDGLKGSLDALAWGKTPPFGTGGQFELIYSGKGHEIDKPADVYDLLVADISNKQNVMEKPNAVNHTSVKSVKFGAQLLYKYGNSASKGLKKLGISKASITISKLFTVNDIWKLESQLQSILKKYEIDERLNDLDKSTLMFALHFHPERDLKIGVGAQDIKVAYHKEHENSRCFMLVRVDGTVEDFSYRKCIRGALEIIDPPRAKTYRTKKQNGSD
ncbi:DNA-directed RNA polymerase IV subunit 1 isoform X2 [Humulus lupulus]|uniref:DNA-directed RNA polymerase IV subunit 1 isoform X2 n=1 Tax=Humulus lupulus TaxID=3486 RepID=UPI002B41108F|nr:DNA-directed RNA polymerase IV subunit 1 isoform X2 [Humulus lupulus]